MKHFTIKSISPNDFQTLTRMDKEIFPLKSQQTVFSITSNKQNTICYVAHALLTNRTCSLNPIGYINVLFTDFECEILSFGVAKNHRGYGVGKALIALTLKTLAGINCQSVFLEVRKSNQPARALYSKFGFKKTGVRSRYYSDNQEDAILMSLHDFENFEYLTFLQSTLDKLCFYNTGTDSKSANSIL